LQEVFIASNQADLNTSHLFVVSSAARHYFSVADQYSEFGLPRSHTTQIDDTSNHRGKSSLKSKSYSNLRNESNRSSGFSISSNNVTVHRKISNPAIPVSLAYKLNNSSVNNDKKNKFKLLNFIPKSIKHAWARKEKLNNKTSHGNHGATIKKYDVVENQNVSDISSIQFDAARLKRINWSELIKVGNDNSPTKSRTNESKSKNVNKTTGR
jgi:hypothetical protein